MWELKNETCHWTRLGVFHQPGRVNEALLPWSALLTSGLPGAAGDFFLRRGFFSGCFVVNLGGMSLVIQQLHIMLHYNIDDWRGLGFCRNKWLRIDVKNPTVMWMFLWSLQIWRTQIVTRDNDCVKMTTAPEALGHSSILICPWGCYVYYNWSQYLSITPIALLLLSNTGRPVIHPTNESIHLEQAQSESKGWNKKWFAT